MFYCHQVKTQLPQPPTNSREEDNAWPERVCVFCFGLTPKKEAEEISRECVCERRQRATTAFFSLWGGDGGDPPLFQARPTKNNGSRKKGGQTEEADTSAGVALGAGGLYRFFCCGQLCCADSLRAHTTPPHHTGHPFCVVVPIAFQLGVGGIQGPLFRCCCCVVAPPSSPGHTQDK